MGTTMPPSCPKPDTGAHRGLHGDVMDDWGFRFLYSGYHTILYDTVVKNKGKDYYEILQMFNNHLGMEAKSLLRAIVANESEDI